MSTGGFAIEPLGESVLLLRFGARIDEAANAAVHAAAETLRRAGLPGVVDLVPAYASLALHYDAAFWAGAAGEAPWRHLAGALRAVFAAPPRAAGSPARRIEIPVCYEAAFAPDLAEVARHCGLSREAVAERHAAGDYRVAMLGFAPGFVYLLGLDAALHVPRRASPRRRVPRGAVGIGGAQTGVYPSELPGGWQLIGRTPLALFDPARDPPCPLAPGDRVRFRAIGAGEFAALEAAARAPRR